MEHTVLFIGRTPATRNFIAAYLSNKCVLWVEVKCFDLKELKDSKSIYHSPQVITFNFVKLFKSVAGLLS